MVNIFEFNISGKVLSKNCRAILGYTKCDNSVVTTLRTVYRRERESPLQSVITREVLRSVFQVVYLFGFLSKETFTQFSVESFLFK